MAEGSDCCDQAKLKKQKVEENIHPIFNKFLLAKEEKEKLEVALAALDKGYLRMVLGILHVESSNALNHETYIESFEDSRINYSAHDLEPDNPGKPKGFGVGDIFLIGLDVLKKYLNRKNSKVPKDNLEREALQNLLIFLTSEKDHKILLEERDEKNPLKWRFILAQHLLSKLSVNSTYTINPVPRLERQDETLCPCSEKDELVGKIGDTSFGCEKGWHGDSAIIIEDEVSVSVLLKDFELSLFSEEDVMQTISQTIAFSFLQRKLNQRKLNNFLIPGIGINAKSILVSLFDTEHDVLLQSFPVDIFDGNSISYITVLFLWLTLNYRLFCTGLPERTKAYKADFIKALGDNAKIYYDDVDRPMHVEIPEYVFPRLSVRSTISQEEKDEKTKHLKYRPILS